MLLDHLRFTPTLLSKPAPRGFPETTLLHFVIVTYMVDPSVLRAHLHPRFEPDCIGIDGAAPQGLVSVVTFLDRDFRFVVCPWFKSSFGQTNYRSYVTDTVTGEHVACSSAPALIRFHLRFLGTSGGFPGTALA